MKNKWLEESELIELKDKVISEFKYFYRYKLIADSIEDIKNWLPSEEVANEILKGVEDEK